MESPDFAVIEKACNDFVISTINKVIDPKTDLERICYYTFDVKAALNRQRIYHPVVSECRSRFESYGLFADYQEDTYSFQIGVRLQTVVFTKSQIEIFRRKMESFGRTIY